jgi:hypothetical protein
VSEKTAWSALLGVDLGDDEPEIDEDFDRYSARSQKAYEAGQKARVLWFIQECLFRDKPIPAWAKRALNEVLYAIRDDDRVRSWDDVLGRLFPKGKHPRAERRKAEIAGFLHHRVCERHAGGEPIGKALFESVGEEFGIGATLTEEIYRQVLRENYFEPEE